MRRPTPLPPTAESSTDAAERVSSPGPDPRAPVDEADREDLASATEVDAVSVDEGSVAPVIPLTSPTTMQRPAELPSTAGPEAADDPTATDDAPVRLREVWAAARARRKALRAEVRRFTGRQRRKRLLWLGGAASVVLLVLATLGAAYSPLFAVEQIRIVGSETLDTLAVEAALKDQLGTPLPLVDESAVKAALVTFPIVESYTLEARPPHELVVRIVERTPIGLIQTRAGYTLVDAAGVALSTTSTPAPGRPVVTVPGGTDSAAFGAVGLVMRSLPDAILDQVTAVAATTPDDVTLTLGGSNAQVVWGSAEDSAMKALVLEKAMIARPPASVFVYDVSSPSAIVVR
jgi:cell division protein FtsQ